jgi:cytochrome c-type biogenesis protein CcmH
MIFWFIAIAVTAIACAALVYAAGPRTVNATRPEMAGSNDQFALVLAGIDADLAAGKLEEADALAAKAELAREILRLKAESRPAAASRPELGRAPLLAGLGAMAVLALALYALLGSPDLPSQPLAGRTMAESPDPLAAGGLDLDAAIARIETALADNPDDLRGWTVIAPAYLQIGRYADAAKAYGRIIALSGPTPDLQTRQAEALLLAADGTGSPAAMTLLRAAAQSDPRHVMSRLYLASELTRQGEFTAAVDAWNAALALSVGDEPWLASARQGLALAQNDGAVPAGAPAQAFSAEETEMIGQMVTGLASRLAASGGSVEEWTQLVRAYLVLDDKAKAQAAFDAAVAAFPQAFDRGDLDTIALEAGLTITGAQP